MIRTLLRQDPALRMLWVTLPASVAVALFTRVLLIDLAAKLGSQNPGLQFAYLLGWLNLWGLLVLVLFKSHFWVRCSRLNITLPLRPRTLWLSRVGALIAATLVPIAFLTVVLALRRPTGDGDLYFDLVWLGRGVHLGLGAVLALFLWHLPSPDHYRAGAGRGYFAYAFFVAAAVFVFVRVTPVWSIFTVSAAALTLAIGAHVCLRLPRAFTLVGRSAADGDPTTPAPDNESTRPAPEPISEPALETPAIERRRAVTIPARTRSTRFLTALTGWRLAHNHMGGWLIIGVICLYSFLLAHGYYNGRNLGPYALFILIWVWYTTNQALLRLRSFDSLPLSRRYVFALASLPALAAVFVGFGIWQLGTVTLAPKNAQIRYAKGVVKVPPEFWEIAHEADIPVITSPWGETHTPRMYRVGLGTDLAVYNPYDTGENSSPRFVSFQFDRAVTAVHGTAAATNHSGGAALDDWISGTNGEGKLSHDAPPVEGPLGAPSPQRLRVVLIGALLAMLIGTVIFFVTMQSYRSIVFKKVYMVAVVGLLMLFVVSVVGAFFVDVWGIVAPEVLDAFPNVLLRKAAERTPIGTTMLFIITAAAFAACYWLIESRFGRAEMLAQKSPKFTEEF